MRFLKKFALTIVVLFGMALVLGLAREVARNSGLILGALPTMALMAPGFFMIHRIWFRGVSKKKRAELATALRQMIDNPDTAPEQRQQATDRLTQLEARGR
jgi:hypothetical protein